MDDALLLPMPGLPPAGEASMADAVLATFERLPRARFMVTTMGTRGALLLERPAQAPAGASSSAQSLPLEQVRC